MTKLSNFQQMRQFVLDLFYPPQCVICQTASQYFCAKCQSQSAYIHAPICEVCGYPHPSNGQALCRQCSINPIEYIDAIRSVATYEDTPLKKAIHKFKYQNKQVLSQAFASLMANCYTKHQLETNIIVPVPLHKARYKERGYNQSTLLAKSLSPLIKQPVNDKALIRHQKTKSQMTLAANERKSNVAEAFSCTSNKLADKSVLLIDDVCTTGATMDACAKALKLANVRSVYGLTLARAL